MRNLYSDVTQNNVSEWVVISDNQIYAVITEKGILYKWSLL